MESVSTPQEVAQEKVVQQTVFSILFAISFTHLLNDMLQAVIPAIYPLLKDKFTLNFTQIGLITFTNQLMGSLFQPFVGLYTDKNPRPYSLAIGMTSTLLGILLLAFAPSYYMVLIAVGLVGLGSSVFHPEASRVAQMASGGRKGLAQSIFQLGGNAGSAIGPLLAALIVIPRGQFHVIWFCFAAVLAIIVLSKIGGWYSNFLLEKSTKKVVSVEKHHNLTKNQVIIALSVLLILIFSKFIYMASMTSYFTFYLIDKFHITVEQSQFHLFIFLAAVAAGTLFGGPLGDKFGRKYIIWISILGAAPFTLMLPYVDLFWTGVFSVIIGLIISSAFSAILVYATELVPGKVGMIAGLFFGFAFGMGGLGSALLGRLADMTSIAHVFDICSYLPLIGIATYLLPNIESKKK